MKRLTKLLSILLAAILLFAAVPAVAAKSDENLPDYISYGDYGAPLGDLQYLLGMDERDETSRQPYFGMDTYYALEDFQKAYKLDVSGEFDGETLYLLLGLDAYELSNDFLVWIPMHGGACYHAAANCSGMLAPQQMPEACAYALGFTACQRCFAQSAN